MDTDPFDKACFERAFQSFLQEGIIRMNQKSSRVVEEPLGAGVVARPVDVSSVE